ncbi:hypothetical protein F53441_3705 [Fusarium austroafricanum]|uniref:DUF7580 domain-containing protein n=1 Tax=Fusarium austroafricanum TaxID=2364996 RepID=A0A8H4KNN7_9HYPO|nr:hypothetical protein F53441_3705 [Fusarium austroafricanum]
MDHTDKLLLWETVQFAAKATKCLGEVVRKSCSDPCDLFCANLQAILASVGRGLAKLSLSELSAFLNLLERLCQKKDFCEPQTYVEQCQFGVSLQELYPTLAPLWNVDSTTHLEIHDISINPLFYEYRKKALANLRCFIAHIPEEKIVAYPRDIDLQAVRGTFPDCSQELECLYQTILAKCICITSSETIAHLRLQTKFQDHEHVAFGVIFKEHPHHDAVGSSSQAWWQDTHISVRLVDYNETQLQPISGSEFCTCISLQKNQGAMVSHFAIVQQQFYFEKFEEPDPRKQWEPDRPSVSFQSLLREMSSSSDHWTGLRKEVLSWLLAKAVWCHYSSKWMDEPWVNEKLNFLFERRTDGQGQELAGIFVNEPFLSVPTKPCQDQNNPPGRFGIRLMHPLPKILALGVMLIEIHLGRPLKDLYQEPEWARHCTQGRANLNTNLRICRDLIQQQGFFDEIAVSLEALIRNCILSDGILMPPHTRSDEDVREGLFGLVSDLGSYVSQRKPNGLKPLKISEISDKAKLPDLTASSRSKRPVTHTSVPVAIVPRPPPSIVPHPPLANFPPSSLGQNPFLQE